MYVLCAVLAFINIVRFFPIYSTVPLSALSRCIFRQVTLDDLATGFAGGISAVLANRLMISIRRYYYTREPAQVDSAPTAVRFRSTITENTTDVSTSTREIEVLDSAVSTVDGADDASVHEDEYEGQGFSERAGF